MTSATMPKRLFPLFLLRGRRLVKGIRFQNHVDVGDPVSQAMIYDAQGAEEIALVDIDATRQQRTIEPEIITAMISTCRLPIAAGGGIRSVEDARRCFVAGADKIIVNTHALLRPLLIKELSEEFGSQSVVVSLDVRRDSSGWQPWIASGTTPLVRKMEELFEELCAMGAGEILLTSIDQEGSLSGMDLPLYQSARAKVSVPLVASGGAGCYDDLGDLFDAVDCDAAAIGKMLFLRDYDIVRIKAFLRGRGVAVREA